MEWKIGEIRQVNGEWYQCVKAPKFGECDGCAFDKKGCPVINDKTGEDLLGYCSYDMREDNEEVIFKKLEKVGEPYPKYVFPRGDVLVQRYKLYIPCDTDISNGYWIHHNDKLVDIELKQNKDMEEKKDNYDGNMDKECISICDALNSIPDVHTNESCCGHCKDRFMIFLTCNNSHSLAIIARVFDRRYIGTSQPWHIELHTKDSGSYDYFIHSETKYSSEEVMMKDVNKITENIKYWCDDKFASYFRGSDDIKHSNSEKIVKDLKPFDPEAAKSGKPVCTRDGHKARIICFDKKCINTSCIIALVEGIIDENIVLYTKDGKNIDKDSKLDLMMLSGKKEGWAVIFKDDLLRTEQDAKDLAEKSVSEVVRIEKIEYEE